MKKLRISISFTIIGIIIATSSCSNEQYDSYSTDNLQPKTANMTELESFYLVVDSLNATVAKTPETRGIMGWGGLTYVADGVFGALGAPLGGFGAFVLGVAASEAYGHYGKYVMNKMNNSTVHSDITDGWVKVNPQTVIAFTHFEKATLDDSIGHIHNLALADLAKANTNYIYNNGSVNYDLLFNDCATSLKKMGIDCDNIMANDQLKQDMANAIDVGIKTLFDNSQGKISFDECIDKIQFEYESKFGAYNGIDMDIIRNMSQKLSFVNVMTNEQLEKYAVELNKTIDSSKLSTPQKNEIKTLSDISINSAMYWNASLNK